jgi:hypothetical protein
MVREDVDASDDEAEGGAPMDPATRNPLPPVFVREARDIGDDAPMRGDDGTLCVD